MGVEELILKSVGFRMCANLLHRDSDSRPMSEFSTLSQYNLPLVKNRHNRPFQPRHAIASGIGPPHREQSLSDGESSAGPRLDAGSGEGLRIVYFESQKEDSGLAFRSANRA